MSAATRKEAPSSMVVRASAMVIANECCNIWSRTPDHTLTSQWYINPKKRLRLPLSLRPAGYPISQLMYVSKNSTFHSYTCHWDVLLLDPCDDDEDTWKRIPTPVTI